MKTFDIITEADARRSIVGATVELAKGGHVTPLAKDTLAARRVTVIPAGSPTPRCRPIWRRRPTSGGWRSATTTPGIALKNGDPAAPARARASPCIDLGTDTTEAVDYPDIAGAGRPDRRARRSGRRHRHRRRRHRIGDRGQQDPRDPRRDVHRRDDRALLARAQRRQRHDAGSTLLPGTDAAIRIVDTWIGTAMREARYIRRLLKIRRLEQNPE